MIKNYLGELLYNVDICISILSDKNFEIMLYASFNEQKNILENNYSLTLDDIEEIRLLCLENNRKYMIINHDDLHGKIIVIR